MRRFPLITLLTLLAAATLAAQMRRAITQDDYDRWRVAQSPVLSPTGAWAAWTEVPQVGDADLMVRETGGSRVARIPRGFIGRPIVNLTAGTDSPFVAPAPQFTPDGAMLFALGYVPMAEFERARKARPKALPAPRPSLILVPLTGASALQPVVVPRVRNVRAPRDAGRVLAYLLEADSATVRTPPDTVVRRGRARDFGTTLVIRNTETGAEERIDDVNSYAFDPSGAYLAYTVVSRTAGRAGAMLRTIASGSTAVVVSGTGP